MQHSQVSLAQSATHRKRISDNVTEFTFLGYKTLIMNKTIFNEETQTFKYYENYINMTKVRLDFIAQNPDKIKKQSKRINELLETATCQKEWKRFQQLDVGKSTTNFPCQITIQSQGFGNLELGTYVHPKLAIWIAEKIDPSLKDLMTTIIEDYIKQENLNELPTVQSFFASIQTLTVDQQIESIKKHLLTLRTTNKDLYFDQEQELNDRKDQLLQADCEKYKLEAEQKELALLEAQQKVQESERLISEQKAKQSKYTGSIYKESINLEGLKAYCEPYREHGLADQIDKFYENLEELSKETYVGQGSDPDPYHRPKSHKASRNKLYQMIKDEPKYLLQVAAYINAVEALPEGIPKFDLDIFITAEILQTGIEVSSVDQNEYLPKRERKTKLTEAEQQWFKIEQQAGRGKWNSIKFDGSLTIEEYNLKIEEEQKKQAKANQDIDALKAKILKLDQEIRRLAEFGSEKQKEVEKKESQKLKKQSELTKRLNQSTASQERIKQYQQNKGSAQRVLELSEQKREMRQQSIPSSLVINPNAPTPVINKMIVIEEVKEPCTPATGARVRANSPQDRSSQQTVSLVQVKASIQSNLAFASAPKTKSDIECVQCNKPPKNKNLESHNDCKCTKCGKAFNKRANAALCKECRK